MLGKGEMQDAATHGTCVLGEKGFDGRSWGDSGFWRVTRYMVAISSMGTGGRKQVWWGGNEVRFDMLKLSHNKWFEAQV